MTAFHRVDFYPLQVVNVAPLTVHLHRLLCSLGMTPYDTPPLAEITSCYTVVMDGKVLGRVDMDLAPSLVNRLRMCKVMGLEKVEETCCSRTWCSQCQPLAKLLNVFENKRCFMSIVLGCTEIVNILKCT